MNQPTSNPLFFFNDTATTEIYTLSLPDALPIFPYNAYTNSLALEFSFNNTVRQIDPNCDGFTHASSVIPADRSKLDKSDTRTLLTITLNTPSLPRHPALDQPAFETVPTFPFPDA